MYRLIFLNGRMKGRRVAVQQGSIVIGRDPSCHLDLTDDESVAPRHATIEERGGNYFLCATDTTNKVLLNASPVSEAALRNGDKIEVGQTLLEFHIIYDQAPIGSNRRVSGLQVAAFAAVVAIVLAEVYFVVIAPMRQKEPKLDKAALFAARKKAEARKLETSAPPVVVQQPVDSEMAHARQLIDAVASASNAAPVAAYTSPVPTVAFAPPAVAPVAPTPVAPTVIAARTNEVPRINAAATSGTLPQITTPAPALEKTVEQPDDPVLIQVRQMLVSAMTLSSTGALTQADRMYDRVQFMAPDYIPAYIERARLYARRAMYREAAGQWKEVEKRAAGTPLAEEAKAEQKKMAQLELAAKSAPPAATKIRAETALSKRVGIVSIEREKFQASGEYDEMRVFHINLRGRDGEALDPADVRVFVAFYDRNADTGRPAPTRAVAPADLLRVDGRWAPGETKSVTATYILPKGFRAEELRLHRERREFDGYWIRVFHKDALVDEDINPDDLAALPPPAPPARAAADMPVGR
jgi:hypothetical protein